MLRIGRHLALGVDLGFTPSTRISYYGEADITYQQFDIYARVFPFGNALFLGVGAGYETVNGSMSTSLDVSPYTSEYPGLPSTLQITSTGSVKTLILSPEVGILHTFGSGLSLGLDAAVQFPIAPSEVNYNASLTNVDTNTAQGQALYQTLYTQFLQPNDQKVRDTLAALGHSVIPRFHLRLGWLF